MTSDTRVWLITGTSSGLGLHLAQNVLAAGERVVATARSPAKSAALNVLREKYPESRLLILVLDVTKPEQIKEAFAKTRAHFGRLDVVVNNAGYGVSAEIEATPDKVARDQFETLFWGPVNVTKEALQFFKTVNPPGHAGRVLNVSSIGGYSANPTLAYYNAGKFALEGFTEAFTLEMPPEWNIKGVIIEPGGFPTTWEDTSSISPHPDYSASAPSNVFRAMRKAYTPIGDLDKAAQAMIRISKEPKPPLRVQLGSDSYGIFTHVAKKALRDAERWEELANSTNQDGVDGREVLKVLRPVLAKGDVRKGENAV
ncbi:NAD(P)-binding protein [Schizophyllum commune Tattone D]|nr:NAD(P)-binding protein [Schizophyllum commune Tattone D]